jgi:hypothetical protein
MFYVKCQSITLQCLCSSYPPADMFRHLYHSFAASVSLIVNFYILQHHSDVSFRMSGNTAIGIPVNREENAYRFIFIHFVVCLTTGPQPLPKRVFRRVRCSASCFNFQYPFIFSRSSSNCVRVLPRIPVTSIVPSIFPSITCFKRQFLRKM